MILQANNHVKEQKCVDTIRQSTRSSNLAGLTKVSIRYKLENGVFLFLSEL